ncbi:hypothetical protein CLHOM_17580 [Clostridium homopropionicum DSM 5847]|uniref:Uncharacterized protein n=1 Tax=Clostridium homopropionicum DSM 5847 TaxID=1121318 RepID=A0A0L6Z9M6_9CLOT|nr:hypothetical protein [Clostridium homopropionicum]KOA19669.1 hypothetical protein CLHOM_17580 [Clostridium homopropionicum DSM 5847]SFF80462.1 hypothetical protein SAMN04488501_102236 [Clostridium homopropionicum]
MFKIIGRLIGIERKELKYNKEIILFTLIGAIIFILLGISHTEKGAEVIYENRLNRFMLAKVEKEGISLKDIDKLNYEYKEAVPVNVSEYSINTIKENVNSYIGKLKEGNNKALDVLINRLQELQEINNKEVLIKELKALDIKAMLADYSKEEIVKKDLNAVKEWQTNMFLSNVYIISGGLMLMSFIVTKVVCEIKLIEKDE